MTEPEYLIVTNRVKISAALNILHDVLAGDDYGVTENALAEQIRSLTLMQDRLFKLIKPLTD